VRSISLKRAALYAGGTVCLIAVLSFAIHPFGRPKKDRGQRADFAALHLPTQTAALVSRSCMDCHSNQTAWPWYSYVAPTSWLVERDVRSGREHMNLSEWQQYSFKQRQKLLADIASAVKNGDMPVPQYTLVHREARLTDSERNRIYQWARIERRRLRTVSSDPSGSQLF
jgi:hypothetical protein